MRQCDCQERRTGVVEQRRSKPHRNVPGRGSRRRGLGVLAALTLLALAGCSSSPLEPRIDQPGNTTSGTSGGGATTTIVGGWQNVVLIEVPGDVQTWTSISTTFCQPPTIVVVAPPPLVPDVVLPGWWIRGSSGLLSQPASARSVRAARTPRPRRRDPRPGTSRRGLLRRCSTTPVLLSGQSHCRIDVPSTRSASRSAGRKSVPVTWRPGRNPPAFQRNLSAYRRRGDEGHRRRVAPSPPPGWLRQSPRRCPAG